MTTSLTRPAPEPAAQKTHSTSTSPVITPGAHSTRHETTSGPRSGKRAAHRPRAGKPGEVRRIFALFAEHKSRLLFVAVLIIASSLISVASPFAVAVGAGDESGPLDG